MHTPFALTPLAQDMFLRVTGAAFTLLRDVQGAAAAAPEVVAGYRLFRVPRTSRTSARRSRTWWTQVNRDRIPLTRALWDDEIT